jgi:DNA polymerase IV (DinB-like DNA polymerase)
MDSFYTAVEKRERPELKDKPVIIVESPQHNLERGAVAACSYEARRFGVRSGIAASAAHRLCPDGVYLEPNHPLYEEVSHRIMDILRSYADTVEEASIDEAYLDISSRAADYIAAEKISREIKRAVKRKESITCSIGVAPNKTIAKIASDHQKPNGLTVVTPEAAKKFLEPLSVDKMPGVGRKTAEELDHLGVKTIGDLAHASKAVLVEHFGKNGAWMWNAANGVDETPVQEVEKKSIGRLRTLDENTRDLEKILNALEPMIDEVHSQAEEEGFLYQNIAVTVIFEDYQLRSKSKTLREHTLSKQAIKETAKHLVRAFASDPRRIHRIGIKVANLKQKKEYGETPLDKYL